MLLPAINLVNINVSRIIERSSEIGVRKAFGASTRTLLGQFVVENVFLTLLAGALSFAGAWIVLSIINDSGILPFGHLEMNLTVFVACLGLSLFFGVFSGVVPAYRMSRLHPVEALRGGAA
jgi:putative ABC transport system permease protein